MAKKKGRKNKHPERQKTAPSPGTHGPSSPPSQESPAELFLALVLAILLVFRPLRDGMVYPQLNIYFIWTILVLYALVCARLLVRGEPLRARLPLILFALFLLIAKIAGSHTVQYNNTYRQLFTWAGHFCLFLVVSNGIRSRRSIAIVFVAFAIAGLAEAAHSIAHLKYYLPLVRAQVAANPEMLSRYLNVPPDQAGELLHRLNANRAFGHQLSPNALAGLMVLCIPFAAGASVHCALAFRRILRANAEEKASASPRRLGEAALVGVASWMLLAVVIFAAYYFFYLVAYRNQAITEHPIRWLVYVGLLPVMAASALYGVTRRHGLPACAWFAGSITMPVVTIVTFTSLFLSYSRGGMLAFAAAMTGTGLLLLWTLRFGGRMPLLTRRAVSVLLVAALGASSIFLSLQTLGNEAAAAEEKVEVQGKDMGTTELMSGATAKLRISYWLTGLRMARDNFWAGVGLGNFGAMYPKYQHLGAGDTKQAHNDYLQVLCETGIFGALAFCALWGTIIVWAAHRIRLNRHPDRLWLTAGVFASVLAFLLHAGVDFDFFNPSLTTFPVFLAGMLFVLCQRQESPREKAPSARVASVPLLFLAALVIGATWRVERADALAGTEQDFRVRMQTAQIFLFQLDPASYDPNKPSVFPQVSEAQILIPNPETLASFSTFWEMRQGLAPRRLGPGEPIPPDARLKLTDPRKAQKAALQAVLDYLDIFEHADAVFPHVPERASQLAAAYDLLADCSPDRATQREYLDQALAWARTALERSPEQAAFHEGVGRALWRRAGSGQDPAKQVEDMRAGLEEYRQATVLFPTSHHLWSDYGEALAGLANALKTQGDTEESQALLDQAAEAEAKAKHIKREVRLANERRAGLR